MPGGYAHLTSVASDGQVVREVLLDITDPGAVSDVSAFDKLGTIKIEGTGGLKSNRRFLSDASLDVTGTPSGRIIVRCGNLEMIGSSITANSFGQMPATGLGINISVIEHMSLVNATIQSNTTNIESAGSIEVLGCDLPPTQDGISNEGVSFANAGPILITDAANLSLDRGFISSDTRCSRGNAKGVELRNIGEINLTNDSLIRSSSLYNGLGDSGEVLITKVGTISLKERSTISSSTIGSIGNSGSVSIIDCDVLELEDSFISSDVNFSNGNALLISITDVDVLLLKNSAIFSNSIGSSGNAGTISINGISDFSINGSLISTVTAGIISSESIALPLGEVIAIISSALNDTLNTDGNVSVVDVLSLSLKDSFNFSDEVFSNTVNGMGNAGEVLITDVAKFSLEDSFILNDAILSNGRAGSIKMIDVTDFFLRNSAVFSNTIGSFRDAGTISITGKTNLLIDGSTIATATVDNSLGATGNILIDQAKSIEIINDGGITSLSTTVGSTGRVEIVSEFVKIDRGIISVATTGKGSGGSIKLNANTISLKNEAAITSESTGINGGNAAPISISATERVSLAGGSFITTEAVDANAGDVMIGSEANPVRTVTLEDSRITTNA